MIFHSAEIRWFSPEKELLWEVYQRSNPAGEGNEEDFRTDFYLRTGSIENGVKVRQGNHELKVRSRRTPGPWGPVEHWTKWSYPEKQHLLEQIPSKKLNNWIEVKKHRWIKKYRIDEKEALQYITHERVDEGCGFEFTALEFSGMPEKWYTLGLEAFSSKDQAPENLLLTIEKLNLNPEKLDDCVRASYPEFLAKYL
jgi:hypothetical protein